MRHHRTTILMLLLVLVASVLLTEEAFGQCAMCKEALKATGREGLIKGFLYSIGVMLAVPTLLVATFATIVVRSNRRVRAFRESLQGEDASAATGPDADETSVA